MTPTLIKEGIDAMRPREILVEAVRELEAAGIPEDLRQVAFGEVIKMLLPTRVGESHGSQARPVALAGDHAESSVLQKISSTLDLETAVISEVFHEEDEGPKPIVGTGKLHSTVAGATKQLALLVAGSRQLGGLEDWTSNEAIRAVCDDFGKYDGPNFAKTVKGMDDVFSFKGKGRNWEVKINRVGQERLKALVTSLTGVDS